MGVANSVWWPEEVILIPSEGASSSPIANLQSLLPFIAPLFSESPYAKCHINISLNPCATSTEYYNTEGPRNLPEVGQLICAKASIPTQICLTSEPMLFSPYYTAPP